jgi:hypothetical protein
MQPAISIPPYDREEVQSLLNEEVFHRSYYGGKVLMRVREVAFINSETVFVGLRGGDAYSITFLLETVRWPGHVDDPLILAAVKACSRATSPAASPQNPKTCPTP